MNLPATSTTLASFDALVHHLLRTNMAEIVDKSRMHCHTRNVHSVVLLDAPGKSIRLFVAEPGHTLHHNRPTEAGDARGLMSVGFHAHHCELTLHCLLGQFFNWEVIPSVEDFDIVADAYRYRSVFRGEAPGFDRIGPALLKTHSRRAVTPGESIFLPAQRLHTVAVLEDEPAAWLVFEGREDQYFNPLCYSPRRLDLEKLDDLYQPMNEFELSRILRIAGIA